jgi:hypothetical protein
MSGAEAELKGQLVITRKDAGRGTSGKQWIDLERAVAGAAGIS